MKRCRWLGLILIFALSLKVAAEPKTVEIDYHCCGEYVDVTPAYSNAVMKSVLPYFTSVTRKLHLPVETPVTPKSVARFITFPLMKTKDQVSCSCTLTNGFIFGFSGGHVNGFTSPRAYFNLQNPADVPKYYGTATLTQEEAVELVRSSLKKMGFSLADAMADFPPDVLPLEQVGTNVIPHYRIQWHDPRSGRVAIEAEVDASKKTIELLRSFDLVALDRVEPKIHVKPGRLSSSNPWQGLNDLSLNINHEYAEKLVPVVLKAAGDWAAKLGFSLKVPITAKQVKRFYCSNNGGFPYVELTLTNNWQFVYRMNEITYCGSPDRFFDSDKLPFRLDNFVGHWNLNEDQATALARRTIANLGFPEGFAKISGLPVVHRPKESPGMPTIPRLLVEWVYPAADKPREQWIEVEIDCDKAAAKSVHFDDVRLWNSLPDLGVSIYPKKN